MPEHDRCCGTSVGVRIRTWDADHGWLYLLIRRGWHPIGCAPVAGHVKDAHTDVTSALLAEVREETGLQVTDSRVLWEGHLPNLCASLPARPVAGHEWTLVDAEVTGELRPDPEETRGALLATSRKLQAMADATIDFARSGAPVHEQPPSSMEAVWVEHLARLGDITADASARRAVARLYTAPPRFYWLGGAEVPAAEVDPALL